MSINASPSAEQSESKASAQWDQVKHCKPSLAAGVSMQARTIRGEPWLLVRNAVTGEQLRLNALGARLILLMDGKNSLESILKLVADQLQNEKHVDQHQEQKKDTRDRTEPVHTKLQAGDEQTQEELMSKQELVDWLGPLSNAGLVNLGLPAEAERLILQKHRESTSGIKRFLNPLSVRIPLHNPDKWLSLVVIHMHWLFNRAVFYFLCTMIFVAAIAVFLSFDEIIDEMSRIAMAPQHWWLYGLMYPLLKALHEFAHAIVIKRWGGSVHECGIAFLVLMPVPYIDASDAWQFPQRSKRILVSAAGMIAEGGLAALAFLLWITIEQGLLSNVAFSIFIMGSLTTVVFNINPLLKFDGYYILQDWLDIPNLADRSNQYYRYVAKRYLLRIDNAMSPVAAVGERKWLMIYGLTSVAYRCFITLVIAFYLAKKFFFIGVLLGAFGITQFFIKPLWRALCFIVEAPELAQRRYRVGGAFSAIFCVLLMFLSFVPLPSSTRTEGVVWVPNQAQLFAAREGEIAQLYVQPGDAVQQGELLMRLDAPDINTQRAVINAKLAAVSVEHKAAHQINPAHARNLQADINALQAELADIDNRLGQLDIRAALDGVFALEKNMNVPGRRVTQGQRLAYIVNSEQLVVRAVLTQQRIERLQAGVTDVKVRLAHQFSRPMAASLTRQTPAASFELPSPALAYDGRRGIAVASHDTDGLRTLERVFHIELTLPASARVPGIGGRAYVTLQHEPESIGQRWWRSTRQLFLKQFTV